MRTKRSPIWIYDKDEILRLILLPADPHTKMSTQGMEIQQMASMFYGSEIPPEPPAEDRAIPYFNGRYTEQLNGEVKLEFEVPADHENVGYIENDGRAVIRDHDGNFVEFIIRTPTDINGQGGERKQVFAEGGDYELIDDFISGYQANEVTLSTALSTVLQATRWSVGRVANLGRYNVNLKDITVKEAVMQLLDLFGGEVRYRIEIDGNQVVRRYIDIEEQRGVRIGKTFVFGKDILDVERVTESEGIKTALYGRGASGENDGPRLTFADVEWSVANGDPVDKPRGQSWVGDQQALQNWGYDRGRKHRFGMYDGQEEDPGELLLATWNDLQNRNKPFTSYRLNVLTLENYTGYDHERVRLGDIVGGVDKFLKPRMEVEATVVAYVLDLNDPSASEITLDNYRDVFAGSRRLTDLERTLNDKQGNWDNKETPEGAQDKANQVLEEAQRKIDEAELRIDEAYLEIERTEQRLEDAKRELEEAMLEIEAGGITLIEAEQKIREVISSPQDYEGYFTGDVAARNLVLTGSLISSGATITGTITASNATFLRATMDRGTIVSATIQDATITGQLSSSQATFLDATMRRGTIIDATMQNAVITGELVGVTGTFVGTLTGARIQSGSTIQISTDAYIGRHLYLGYTFSDTSYKAIYFRGSGTGGPRIESPAGSDNISLVSPLSNIILNAAWGVHVTTNPGYNLAVNNSPVMTRDTSVTDSQLPAIMTNIDRLQLRYQGSVAGTLPGGSIVYGIRNGVQGFYGYANGTWVTLGTA
jgi:phage minor structural protein